MAKQPAAQPKTPAQQPARGEPPDEGTSATAPKPKAPPALKVQEWPLGRFREYANNPRVNDHAVEQMAAMIKEFGFRVPMLARSSGELVDGHLRLKAARQLGLAKLPVIMVDDLTDAQIKALRISVNQAANLADWNLPLLKAELAELKLASFDLPLLGFPEAKLVQFMAQPTSPDQFKAFGEDLPTEYCCPSCNYKWSGSPTAGAGDAKPPAENGAK